MTLTTFIYRIPLVIYDVANLNAILDMLDKEDIPVFIDWSSESPLVLFITGTPESISEANSRIRWLEWERFENSL